MRWIGLRTLAVALCLFAARNAFGQAQGPSDTLAINGDSASNWQEDDTTVLQVQGHVTITTDDATMTADNAVIWIKTDPGAIVGEQMAEFALIGNAKIVHGQATRSNDELYITEQIRDQISFYGERIARDASDTDIYKQASALRPQAIGAFPTTAPVVTNTWLIEPPSTEPTTEPTSRPTTQPSPVYFEADKLEQTIGTDGKVAYILTGNVLITQNKISKKMANVTANDQNEADITDHIELRADHAVILTSLDSMKELTDTAQFKLAEDIAEGAYLEGDVRILQTPAAGPANPPENRLDCSRVYYEFSTERAYLTDAVIHTVEPKINLPIIIRADVVRQLSMGEYRAQHAEMTTSSFAVPSYSVRASTAYIRQVPTFDPRYGNETKFVGTNAVFSLFHVPFFYLPYASGTMTDKGSALRDIEMGSSSNNGFGIQTEFGLFESLGILPPDNDDAYVKLDYFSDRGFGIGFNAKYAGGFITENDRQPWDFQGDFKSYFLPDDEGTDKLGKDRRNIGPDAPLRDPQRGHFQYEHQQFFPDDWQFQFRFGLVTDPTFLEYWEEGSFNDDLPHDFEAYVKKQKDTEAFTLLYEFQPNESPTTAGQLQEYSPRDLGSNFQNFANTRFFEVERIPELGYYRIGDSFGDDSLTFFSANTLSVLHYHVDEASLVDEGFRAPNAKEGVPLVLPGIQEIGQTGLTNKNVIRGDFRQEIDYPLQIDKFKTVPYVMGRLTSYSDSVDGGSLNRALVGAGLRTTTAFWKVDDTAQSDLFDIHRLRHIIEPELNLFTSASNKDSSDAFIFDQSVDAVNDVSAAQIALNQRWETKRGGPGNWRSVDFFTLNMAVNLFTNKPDADEFPPDNFRGLFYTTDPEASIPRDSFVTDALWRVSDTTVVLADLNQNLDKNALATASIGMAVQRDIRLQYFVGLRYIGDIHSTVASFLVNYMISPKYSVLFKYSFDFSENSAEEESVQLTRNFDKFFFTIEVFHDEIEQDSGVRVGFFPTGLGTSSSTAQLQNLFGGQQ